MGKKADLEEILWGLYEINNNNTKGALIKDLLP